MTNLNKRNKGVVVLEPNTGVLANIMPVAGMMPAAHILNHANVKYMNNNNCNYSAFITIKQVSFAMVLVIAERLTYFRECDKGAC